MQVISAGKAEALEIKGSLYKIAAIASVERTNYTFFDKSKAITAASENRRATTESDGYKKWQELKQKLYAKRKA